MQLDYKVCSVCVGGILYWEPWGGLALKKSAPARLGGGGAGCVMLWRVVSGSKVDL